eukprot:CAMPEP_0116022482 /NCGR_PEP_ID=MMETSP0321-20121206/11017_1 /TAXON_ID=163516 /ORGANISM="Leptocylindrus danicus var. danicus, Strain B650" /LENGTH=427 /DNA_ID=CAMNT_0003493569 /DNA_START=114 /DNA_END=1394 /DNA_ORIENTATION=-
MITYWEAGSDDSSSNTVQVKYADDSDIKQYNHTSCVYEDMTYISPYFHHVRLDDLKPDTEYVYRCTLYYKAVVYGDVDFMVEELLSWQEDATSISRLLGVPLGSRITESEELSFETALIPGDGTKSLKFALIADYGQTEASLSTRDLLLDEDVDMILIAGDLAYANTVNELWDEWFELNEELFSKVPTMPAPGNHEVEIDNVTSQIFVPYENRFGAPQVKDAEIGYGDESTGSHPSSFIGVYDYGNAFYTFSSGLGTFIVLNCYTSSEVGSNQYNFLIETLEGIERDVTPWVLVMLHCPLYNTFFAHQNETQTVRMKENFEKIFVEYNVNIVFSGHTHGYLRSKPVAFDEVFECGDAPLYIGIGDGGQRGDEIEFFLNRTPEDWVECRDGSNWSFGTLEIFNSTTAEWTRRLSGVNKWEDYNVGDTW